MLLLDVGGKYPSQHDDVSRDDDVLELPLTDTVRQAEQGGCGHCTTRVFVSRGLPTVE